jgi:hypothetical protein
MTSYIITGKVKYHPKLNKFSGAERLTPRNYGKFKKLGLIKTEPEYQQTYKSRKLEPAIKHKGKTIFYRYNGYGIGIKLSKK